MLLSGFCGAVCFALFNGNVKEYNATFATSATLHSLFCMEETLRGAKTKVRYSFWTLDIWDVFLNKWGMRRWKQSFKKKCRKKYSVKMVFFSQNTRNCCFSFYKNSIKPSTYSIRIFTKDLELQLSKKCTNRIYYFSVSLSTSSSSSLFIFIFFFLFFAYLHLFWSTSSRIFYFSA